MTEQDRPKLSLGQPPGQWKHRMRPLPRWWLWLFLVLQALALACLAALWLRPAGSSVTATVFPKKPDDDVQKLRHVALNLEERGLSAQAARAWQDYLEADPDSSERAEILYRTGKLYFDAEQYDESAAALVRADMAAGENHELKSQIGRKLVDALRRGGRYGEVGRELSRQVEVGGSNADEGHVLATLAGEKITEADLDRMIERRVDNMLQMQGSAGDGAAREALLKRLSEPAARQQMLQELLQTELFCRRARELKLDQHEDFLRARDAVVESLLASRFLADQLKRIQPTEVDLDSYYKANQERYREPEELRAVVIPLGDGEDPAPLLEKIKSADDFRKLAAERQPEGTAEGEAPSRRIVRGRDDPLLGPTDGLFALAPGEWTKTPHAHAGRGFLVLVDQKTPQRKPALKEVLDRVRADYVARKQQEWTEQLFGDLLSRYDVRIMPPGGEKEGEKEKEDTSNRDESASDHSKDPQQTHVKSPPATEHDRSVFPPHRPTGTC